MNKSFGTVLWPFPFAEFRLRMEDESGNVKRLATLYIDALRNRHSDIRPVTHMYLFFNRCFMVHRFKNVGT